MPPQESPLSVVRGLHAGRLDTGVVPVAGITEWTLRPATVAATAKRCPTECGSYENVMSVIPRTLMLPASTAKVPPGNNGGHQAHT
jgi:hypothetical protein